MLLFQIFLSLLLILPTRSASVCQLSTYPRFIGGSQSYTTILAIDADSNYNIVVGGSTYSSTFNAVVSSNPFLINILNGNVYVWSKILNDNSAYS